jgi:hypothetical protein
MAMAQQVIVNEHVNFGSFDQSDKTFHDTSVYVTSAPCPDASYAQNLGAGNVKSEEEAKANVKVQVDQITDALQRQYNKCHKS